jgi:DNA-binding transcriptional LysR family regulator
MQKLWPDIVFRPLKDPTIQIEEAIVYRRDARSPVLDAFLNALRQFVRKTS